MAPSMRGGRTIGESENPQSSRNPEIHTPPGSFLLKSLAAVVAASPHHFAPAA
jgi:hypothetical protein